MDKTPDIGLAPALNFPLWAWVAFCLFVAFMLFIDLFVLNRKAHVVRFREALIWSVVCIACAFAFNAWIWIAYGKQYGQEFLAGYLLEEALSVDNLFVFIMIFTFFNVKREYQHRLLFWGIMGALVLRGIMIAAGVALLEASHYVFYLFGAILIYTGIKMAFHDSENADPTKSFVYKAARKFLPVADGDFGQKFFVRINGKLHVTILFLVLIVIETTDLLFALDSIPAVLAVTKTPFIVYTSNVFAIIGLRALFFVLAGVMDMFRYLKYGLALVLVFVGVKMMLAHTSYKIPITPSLLTIGAILLVSVVVSVLVARREHREGRTAYPHQVIGSDDEDGGEQP